MTPEERLERAVARSRTPKGIAATDKFIRQHNGRARTWNASVVYFVLAASVSRFKIGKSSTFDNRLDALRTGSPVELTVLGTIQGGIAMEGWCHRQMEEHSSHREWFRWNSRTRAFVDLLLAHGHQAGRVLCPQEYKSDFMAAEGRRWKDDGGAAPRVGDVCRCESCLLYASLIGGKS